MHSHLDCSPELRKQHLHSLNHAVLSIIQHKKYPLNYHQTNRTHGSPSYRLRKLQTSPNEYSSKNTKRQIALTGQVWRKRQQNLKSIEPTMGEHLQLLQGNKLELPYRSSECFEEVNKQLVGYLWEKRKYNNNTASTTREQKGAKKVQEQKFICLQSKKSAQNVSKLLKSLRKNLADELLNQPEYSQFEAMSLPVTVTQTPAIKAIDFYEGESERIQIARKYPVRKVKVLEDLNKQLIVELARDLRQKENTQKDDKYTKMRIHANHRKIISMS